MDYEKSQPVTSERRRERRIHERHKTNAKEEMNRKKAVGGGQPNELGVTQGQNGEQGNSRNPRLNQDIGRSAH
jgi:hypothetical protein